MNEQVQSELKKIFNGRFSTSVSTRTNYARGEDTYDPVLSQAVVFPETNSEVSKILKICNDHKVPVVPFGTGTSLEGNVVGNDKGITISLEKMNKVLSVNVEDFDCRVQACVTKEQLNDYLREDGVFFPIDPGANAAIGGMASTAASFAGIPGSETTTTTPSAGGQAPYTPIDLSFIEKTTGKKIGD